MGGKKGETVVSAPGLSGVWTGTVTYTTGPAADLRPAHVSEDCDGKGRERGTGWGTVARSAHEKQRAHGQHFSLVDWSHLSKWTKQQSRWELTHGALHPNVS